MAKTVNEENIKRDVARILDCVNTLSPLSNKMVGDSQDMRVEYSVGEQLGHIKNAANEILGQIGAAGTIGSSRKSIKSSVDKKMFDIIKERSETIIEYSNDLRVIGLQNDIPELVEIARNLMIYADKLDDFVEESSITSSRKSIKSAANRKQLPTHAFVDAFVDKLNAYCDKEFGDTDPEFTKKYGKLYDFKYRSMNKMLNDGWGNEYDGIVIYDDQGSLDWFEDEFLPKWIDEELGKSGFYAEPVGSSRFVIAVE